jgi:hypothetical protein
MKSLLGTTLGSCLVLLAAQASTADALGDVRGCMPIADDAERVACYDRALGRRSSAAAAQAAPAPSAAASEEFGLSEQARREREGVDLADSIDGTVAAVGRNTANRQVVTLHNGQVWVQAEATTRVRLKAGDVVTIKRAAMGSYILAKPNHGAMRVKRLD